MTEQKETMLIPDDNFRPSSLNPLGCLSIYRTVEQFGVEHTAKTLCKKDYYNFNWSEHKDYLMSRVEMIHSHIEENKQEGRLF